VWLRRYQLIRRRSRPVTSSLVTCWSCLIAYGSEWTDQYRRAAGYVDRILKGDKPADLPVQASTRFAGVDTWEVHLALRVSREMSGIVQRPRCGRVCD
jgi:hypothetical protein